MQNGFEKLPEANFFKFILIYHDKYNSTSFKQMAEKNALSLLIFLRY